MALDVEGEWFACLEQIRQREGLTLDRLRAHMEGDRKNGISGWAKISQTPFITAIKKELNIDLEEIIIEYIRIVRKRLSKTHYEVVGWSLNLEIEQPFADYQLGERQKEITKRLGAKSPASYRATLEPEGLRALAKALDNPEQQDLLELGVSEELLPRFIATKERVPVAGRGKVTIIGAAVMDLNFVLTHMPESGESVQAQSFETSPGGKGLSQAVACARLGLDTTLISVVGDDENGKRILQYLKEQDVSVELIQIRTNCKTAVTAVFTRSTTGGSSAVGWKNGHQLHFSSDTLDQPRLREQILKSDFVLCSFEAPEPVITKALQLAKKGGAVTIVTPAPPYYEALISSDAKSNIDYIVANMWELNSLSVRHGQNGMPLTIEEMARELMIRDRVRNVIVTHNTDCHAFFQKPSPNGEWDYRVVAGYSTKSETAGERDAFCAMLACRLLASRNEAAILEAIKWATCAMGCLRTVTSVPESMPTYEQVERLLKQSAHGGFLKLLDPKDIPHE